MPFAGAMATFSILLPLLLAPFAEGQSSKATSESFMMEQTLFENGCGAFAGLVAATAGAGEAFREQIASDDGGSAGLTIFCPDDEAVAAFGLGRFSNLSADGQVALLLYHGVAALYSEEALRATDRVVATLASRTDDIGILAIRDYGGTVILSSPQNEAGVTKMVVGNDRLVVYLIDAVLVPGEPAGAPYGWVPILVLCLAYFGLPLLVVLLAALLAVVRLLRRSCQDCCAAHASAARVVPHG